MITEQVEQVLSQEIEKRGNLLREQLHYLRELRKEGIISPSEPQTFFKYPTTVLLNHSYK